MHVLVPCELQKKKSGVKKCLEICAIKGGGVGPLMANAIKNFHFDFLTTSLKGQDDVTHKKYSSMAGDAL